VETRQLLLPLPLGCPLAGDPCLTYQQYYLCVAAVSLGSAPLRDASIEDLVKGVLSDFYPQQVAAFILAKRWGGRLGPASPCSLALSKSTAEQYVSSD